MGGYGAFYAALKRPKQYNTAFSYSGLLNLIERYDNPQGIDMYPVFGTREELIDNNFDLYSLFNKKVQMTVNLWITLQNLLLHVDYRIRDFI